MSRTTLFIYYPIEHIYEVDTGNVVCFSRNWVVHAFGACIHKTHMKWQFFAKFIPTQFNKLICFKMRIILTYPLKIYVKNTCILDIFSFSFIFCNQTKHVFHRWCGLMAFELYQWGLDPKVESHNGNCLGLLAWVMLESLVGQWDWC